MSKRKPYNVNAGYICSRHNIINNGWVVIYFAPDQGLDCGPGNPFVVVCETHGTLVGVPTVKSGRPLLKIPDFCEECMNDMKGLVTS